MTKSNKGSLIRVFRGHLRGIYNVHEMPNGDLLTIGDDRTLRIWDRAGRNHKILHAHVSWRQISITPSGIIFAFAFPSNHQHGLYVWDENYNLIRYLEQDRDNNWGDAMLALTSGYVLTLSDKGDIRMWYPHGAIYRVMKRHSHHAQAKELTDGSILSWGASEYGVKNDDTAICLWSHDGHLMKTYHHHQFNMRDAHELPDGRMVSYDANDNRDEDSIKPIYIWDRDGEDMTIIPAHQRVVMSALVLRDGCFITTGGDPILRLWGANGVLLAQSAGRDGAETVWLIELKDGRMLTWGENDKLHVWQLPELDIPTLSNPIDIYPIALLEDDSDSYFMNGIIELMDGRLVTCGTHNTIHVWQLPDEIKTGSVIRPIKRLVGHVGEVSRLVLLRDGSFASCGQDGMMCLWRL